MQVGLVIGHVSSGASQRGEGTARTRAVGHDALDVAGNHIGVVAQPADRCLVVDDERRRTAHLAARRLAYLAAHAALEELRGHLAARAAAHAGARHHIAMLERAEDGVGAAAVRVEARLVGGARHIAAHRVGHEDGHLAKRQAQRLLALVVGRGHKQVEPLDGIERLCAVRQTLPRAVADGALPYRAGLLLVVCQLKAQFLIHGATFRPVPNPSTIFSFHNLSPRRSIRQAHLKCGADQGRRRGVWSAPQRPGSVASPLTS